MTNPASPSKGLLGNTTTGIGKVLGYFGLPWTQKFVAHIATAGLTGAAVALLPLGISTELNGVIVVVAGLVAHWVAPPEA